MPWLTLPRPRQRAKNIYDLLPRQQEELGRHPSRSLRVFSTESLLSRSSDSPEHAPSQAGSALQVHRAYLHTVGYTVGVYDNASVPQMYGDVTSSAPYVNIRAPEDCLSISSEDSNDYVNVPRENEIAETLISVSGSPRNVVLPTAQELEFTEESHEGWDDAGDWPSAWSPPAKGSDPLSDGDSSSQTSHDYVNLAGLDLEVIQEQGPRTDCRCGGDYVNVPPEEPNRSQQQAEEELTSSNTNCVAARTESVETHVQPVTRRFLPPGDYVAFQPFSQSEDSQMKHEEEVSSEDSHDYENVLVASLGGRDSEQVHGTQHLPDE
ncbi:lymphocyte transmembrane adapter 1 isoform X2 [Tupaia chinensis]|nr:lymphocyte transmembrane adapter 1 isoform X2 [Tupaia chinensis]